MEPVTVINGVDLDEAVREEERYLMNIRNLEHSDGILDADEFANEPVLKWAIDQPTVTASESYYKTGVDVREKIDAQAIHGKIIENANKYALGMLISPNINPASYEYKPGFVIAGGAIHELIINPSNADAFRKTDIDLFAIGMTEEEAETKINEWIALMERCYEPDDRRAYSKIIPAKRINTFKSMHTKHTITAKIMQYSTISMGKTIIIIQFITKLYGNVSRLLHNFDISVSDVAADMSTIYFTKLASLSYRSGVVPLELAKRRSTFELRLSRYFGKWGNSDVKFSYVMPNLNKNRIDHAQTYTKNGQPEERWISMGNIIVNCARISGNIILAASISPMAESPIVNTYDEKKSIYKHDKAAALANFKSIMNGELPVIYTLKAADKWTDSAVKYRWIVDTRFELNDLVLQMLNNVVFSAKNIFAAKRIVGERHFKSMLKIIEDADITSAENKEIISVKMEKLCETAMTEFYDAANKFDYSFLCEQIENAILRENVNTHVRVTPDMIKSFNIEATLRYQERLGWHDDTTDAPFNFVITPPEIWYGDYYRP